MAFGKCKYIVLNGHLSIVDWFAWNEFLENF